MYILNWRLLDQTKLFKTCNLNLIKFLEDNKINAIAKNQIDKHANNISVFFICDDLNNALQNWNEIQINMKGCDANCLKS